MHMNSFFPVTIQTSFRHHSVDCNVRFHPVNWMTRNTLFCKNRSLKLIDEEFGIWKMSLDFVNLYSRNVFQMYEHQYNFSLNQYISNVMKVYWPINCAKALYQIINLFVLLITISTTNIKCVLKNENYKHRSFELEIV